MSETNVLLPVETAFARFCDRYFPELKEAIAWPRRHELTRLAHAAFIERLRDGHLDLVAFNPKKDAGRRIPREAWSNAFFPERPLDGSRICGVEGPLFRSYVDRVPMVSEAQLEAVLTAGMSTQQLIREVAVALRPEVRGKTRDAKIIASVKKLTGKEPSERSIRRALESKK
jgi:hypothetical protein